MGDELTFVHQFWNSQKYFFTSIHIAKLRKKQFFIFFIQNEMSELILVADFDEQHCVASLNSAFANTNC